MNGRIDIMQKAGGPAFNLYDKIPIKVNHQHTPML